MWDENRRATEHDTTNAIADRHRVHKALTSLTHIHKVFKAYKAYRIRRSPNEAIIALETLTGIHSLVHESRRLESCSVTLMLPVTQPALHMMTLRSPAR